MKEASVRSGSHSHYKTAALTPLARWGSTHNVIPRASDHSIQVSASTPMATDLEHESDSSLHS
jgi:hypothetical protein